ncbi:uncharacterized protein [Pyrus communis]|uniref:uncharacterized protein n=1 Tax=Pyrus communis TaxID=23211 RepID=UPI0035BF7ABD
MGDLQVVGGIKKLNNKNYNIWASCMKSYLQGQDLWDVVNGNESALPAQPAQPVGPAGPPAGQAGSPVDPAQPVQPIENTSDTMRKKNIKIGKAMFALKTTVEDDMLEYIWKANTPKEAWDTLATLFSIRKNTRLQLLENELYSVAQRDMTIAEYFHKVKSICDEISELDPSATIVEPRIKRIIIHGLRPEFRGIVVAVQGWQTQPSLVEFENLLADQEAMAKQMGRVSLRGEEESLYTISKGSFKQRADGGSKINGDKEKGHQGRISTPAQLVVVLKIEN